MISLPRAIVRVVTDAARLRLVHGLFFVSGASALVYEVLWMRRFTLLFGASAPATAATLAAFFFGIALGSLALGELAGTLRRPLWAFGLIEVGIGVAALVVVPVLAWAETVLPVLGRGLGAAPTALLAVKVLIAMMALLPPTLLIGGGLPVLARAIESGGRTLGVRAGGLYAINTIGAALGALAVPVILLPAIGGAGSLLAAVGMSLIAGCTAFALDPRDAPAIQADTGTRARRMSEPTGAGPAATSAPSVGSLRACLAAAFLSGLLVLSLETLGARMLALVHENSLYSFATVLAVFLAGLAAGAGAARAHMRRGTPPERLLRWGWIGGGLWVAVMPRLFLALSSNLRYVGGESNLAWHETRVAGLASVVLLPAALLSGLVLPAIIERAGARSGAASSAVLGRILFANTLGAIAGPLIVLFVLGPLLGLWTGIALVGALMALAGATFAPGRRAASASAVVLVAAVSVFLAALPRVRLEPGERIVDLRESAFGTVAVIEADGERRLNLNNSYVLGGTLSTGEERLQAHIPLLLHRAPRTVAFLGIGTGITASGALFHPVERIVAMELIPEVVDAARAAFREANLGLLDDPRVRVVRDDARTRLRDAPGAFDVIVGDLVVPWRRGESSLFTLESFLTARRALAPGGLYCQWVPLFQMSEREFDSIAATFLDVFPRALLFRGDFRAGEPAVGLVGLTSDVPLDPAQIDARVRSLERRPDPTNPYLAAAAGLWAYLVGPLAADDPDLLAAPRSLEDRPVVELSTPLVHVGGQGRGTAALTRERLAVRVDRLLARPLSGSALERLDAQHRLWRQAGADIWRASLLSLQGRDEEADRVGFAALGVLPPAIRSALERRGDAGSGTAGAP